MKKLLTISSIILFSAFSTLLNGQCLPLKVAKEAGISLTMSGNEGTNGSAVVWNPLQKKYYAVIAGNGDYPIETYDIEGNSLGSTMAGEDMRGMWWNPATNTLEGNTYDGSWVSFQLSDGDASGESNIIRDAVLQPIEQAVGTYNPDKKQVLYYYDGIVYTYKRSNGKGGKQITLKNIPADVSDINSYSMIYTGCKGFEFGILNFNQAEVYLFNTSGAYQSTVALPEGAPVNYAFWVSYANGKLFLFNAENRTWTGYIICK